MRGKCRFHDAALTRQVESELLCRASITATCRAPRWRLKLALRGARRSRGVRGGGADPVRRGVCSGCGSRRSPSSLPDRDRGASFGVLASRAAGPAADAARDRRAGRALPRGARAVARGGHHQRRRGASGPGESAAVAGARPQAGRERDRESAAPLEDGRRVERNPVRRYSGALGGVLAIAARGLPARPGLHAPRAVGAAGDLAQRRGGGAVPHRGHAGRTPRFRAAPTSRSPRSSSASRPTRPSLMIRKSPTAAFERRAADPQPRTSYEGTLFDVAAPVDYFVEARRRALAGLHAQGRRHAVRPEAGAGVPLPGLHRPRAAQDRGRRRHRGPARHRNPRPRGADHGGGTAARSSIDDKTQVPMTVAGRRRAAGDVHRRSRRLLPDRARCAGRSAHRRARRSTRSTCSPISRRRCRSVNPGATRRRRRSRKSSSRRRRKTTTASRSLELVYSVNGGAREDGQAVRRHDAHDRRVGRVTRCISKSWA